MGYSKYLGELIKENQKQIESIKKENQDLKNQLKLLLDEREKVISYLIRRGLPNGRFLVGPMELIKYHLKDE